MTSLVEIELARLERAKQAVTACEGAIQAAATEEAQRLQETHPDVYEIAMVLENEGMFYKHWTKPAIIATAAVNGIVEPWKRWSHLAAQGLNFYKRHHCTRDWTPPAGAAELLAAYFLTVKYAEDIAELSAK